MAGKEPVVGPEKTYAVREQLLTRGRGVQGRGQKQQDKGQATLVQLSWKAA